MEKNLRKVGYLTTSFRAETSVSQISIISVDPNHSVSSNGLQVLRSGTAV